jgi:aryl-alcohol dehydrogenase-like predicted oxidoreductase
MEAGLLKRVNYQVPKLILGTHNWGDHVDLPEARSQLRTYLAAGGFAIDISPSTKALPMAGELLAELTNRESFQVHVNLPQITNFSQAQDLISNALAQSGLDHFDLTWLSFDFDNLSIHEIVNISKSFINSEKTRYLGALNQPFWQTVFLDERLLPEKISLAGLKINWSLLRRGLTSSEIKASEFFDHSLIATSPTALGLLTGKYRFSTPSDSLLARNGKQFEHLLTSVNQSKIEALATAAAGLEVSLTELALAWLLAQSQVSGILINARNTAQLNQLLASLSMELPVELFDALNEVADFE